MEVVIRTRQMELYPYQRDDIILLLQEYVIHHTPIHHRLLLRIFRLNRLRRRLRHTIQLNIHRTTTNSKSRTRTGYQLHDQREIIITPLIDK